MNIETIKIFLESQPLLSMFLVIGIGYAIGEVNIRGFSLGVGAVLFVALGFGILVPKAAPPALLGSLGLVMFVYGIGIQYGKQFFRSLKSSFGLRANILSLFTHLVSVFVCYLAYTNFSIAPTHLAGLFCGALTSTPALQSAIDAAGNSDPALGYSVAYPLGVIVPIMLMHFANLLLKPKIPAPTGTGLDLVEIVVRNRLIIGRPLSEVSAMIPLSTQIVIVREGHKNKIPSPDIVLDNDDVVAVAGESAEDLALVRVLLGEAGRGDIIKDRMNIDYFRVLVSKRTVVGITLADLKINDVSEFSVVHVRRGDTDLLPRPELILEFGDRVGVIASRAHRDKVRAHFGDSIKGTTEFSYISLGIGMSLGVLLGILPIPLPGVGAFTLGVAGGPLVVALVLGYFGRTRGWVWTIPVSANLTLRNFGLTLFLAQVGMVSGPKFILTLQQLGTLFIGFGAIIVLTAVLFTLFVGHFIFRLRFDDLLGVLSGITANPAILAFGSKLVPTDRTDIAYAITFPAATIMKIILVQIMLSLMIS